MKHCPNIHCSFFLETGMVAEFNDEVMVCPDCETPLVDGDAPQRTRPVADGFESNADRRTVVSTVESLEEAQDLGNELEQAGIMTVIALSDQNSGEVDPDSETALYDVLVLDQQVMSALEVIHSLLDDDGLDGEFDDALDEEFIDDFDETVDQNRFFGDADENDPWDDNQLDDDAEELYPTAEENDAVVGSRMPSRGVTLIAILGVLLLIGFLIMSGWSN